MSNITRRDFIKLGAASSGLAAAGLGTGSALAGSIKFAEGGRDFENTKFILNFGSNVLEAHTNHVPEAQRCIAAMAQGVPMYTFDVHLSNTAAKSTEWVPIKPGTDLAVVLAMCNVLMENDICDKEFIETYTNVTVDELKTHLAQYTPQWAEKISGVPAEKIRTIALAYGRAKPSVCISYRGAVMHYNGVQTERAIFMLEAIAGNIDCPGGRCRAVGASWKFTFPKPTTKAGKLHVLDGEHGAYAYPTHHASHQVFHMINNAPEEERPYIYMFYCYNPVYVNGNIQANIDLMKDEKKMPFIVSVDIALSESTDVAQQCGDGTARKGFPPDSHRWKTGILELRSKALADNGFHALPSWMPIPEHEKMRPDDLHLTTFKVNAQTHSRTQQCKWLTEIYHENPAWIHPKTAAARQVNDGDLIKVKSSVGEIITKVRVTESIVPGTVAISYHCGHWAWGGYASGKACKDNYGHVCEPDCDNKWWSKNSKDKGPKQWREGRGVHVNWIIPNVGDPIGGGQRWMDGSRWTTISLGG